MTADTVGGVWTYALELCRALAPHDVEVALATMGAPVSPRQREEACRLPNITIHESRFKLEWMDDPWADVRAASDWLLRIEQEVRPDVVHLNGYAHGALPWRAPVLVAAHSCVLSWWEAVRREAIPDAWERYRRTVTEGLRAADVVIAPTGAMLQMADRHYGPFRASRVIHNGRSPAQFWPGAREPFVLAAGRLWDEAKNIGLLDRIAPDLPWPVYVAGEARSPQGGAATAPHVRSLGPLPGGALADWMGRASVYALPARYEPFGLSALEAALSGCALVLGDIPSLREVWADAALFVNPNDSDALKNAIRSLIDSPRLRADMSQRALNQARAYTPERMACETLACYRALMDRIP